MNKCTKCGTEFEGKFCPECGTPVNDKPTCPRCGSEVNPTARFCANCGCNLSQPDAQEQQAVQASAPVQTAQDMPRQNEIVINWRRLLHYLPMVFFALWAVLLWAFYASHVINGDGFLTDTANLYQLLKDDMMSDMFATARALIAFAAIADLYAVVLGWTSFKARGIVGKIVNYASFAFHLVIVICAGVLSGQCKQFFDGFDDYNGNFAAVVISLTVVFPVLQAAALVLDKFFGDNTPVVKQNVVKKQRKHFTKPTFMIKAGIWMRLHKVQATIISVTLAATLVAAVVLSTVLPITLGNIFRIGEVNQINLGDTPEQVEKVLGEPFESTEYLYAYYSKNVTDKMKELKNLNAQIDNATSFSQAVKLSAQIEMLEQKIRSIEYKYIGVSFADGKVTGVLLDTKCKNDTENVTKQATSIELSEIPRNANPFFTTIYATIYYYDGSYKLSVISNVTDCNDGQISWRDSFGSYIAPLKYNTYTNVGIVGMGVVAPDFDLQIYGKSGSSYKLLDTTFKLSDHLGEVTVVNFWATWCGQSVAEISGFNSVAEDYPEVNVIGVHGYSTENVAKFIRDKGWADYAMTFVQDELDGDTCLTYNSCGGRGVWPMTLIVGKDGKVTCARYGSFSENELRAEVEKALAQKVDVG